MAEFVLTREIKLQELSICDNFIFQQVMKNKSICSGSACGSIESTGEKGIGGEEI